MSNCSEMGAFVTVIQYMCLIVVNVEYIKGRWEVYHVNIIDLIHNDHHVKNMDMKSKQLFMK